MSEDIKKIYYTMGEVAEMFDVNQSLIRYWNKEFSILRPSTNKKGNRLFKQKDIDAFALIYHLVKEKKMTIDGAKLYINNRSLDELSKESLVVEKLQNIKTLLEEVLHGFDDDNSNKGKVVFIDEN